MRICSPCHSPKASSGCPNVINVYFCFKSLHCPENISNIPIFPLSHVPSHKIPYPIREVKERNLDKIVFNGYIILENRPCYSFFKARKNLYKIILFVMNGERPCYPSYKEIALPSTNCLNWEVGWKRKKNTEEEDIIRMIKEARCDGSRIPAFLSVF